MEMKGDAIEEGDLCSCGGTVDILFDDGNIQQGRCFQCGKLFTIPKR
uniref:Uncharacterized protein n=1 Tax=viral metagenome TaxID=1070528 RepID=A0A6M3XVY5_9ZZZZ